jgi:hypothetical protein
VIHRSAGKYPLNQERRRAGVLSGGECRQEVHYPGAVDAITAKTKLYTYPEWRKRMLLKCIASGRRGSPTPPAWKTRLNLNDLPREMQKWRENEEEEKGKKMLDREENEPVSMTSDAEWEGWKRELELDGPNPPGLKATREGNPWTSDRTLSPNRTVIYGRTSLYREETRC